MNRVCVFCGSSAGDAPIFLETARAFGTCLAGKGIELVYGGASVGLMGAIADAALAAGGRVIGVIPRALEEREIAHTSLSQLEVVGSMHERKARMAELADGFVAMPGGLGTLEELFEVWTWAQLGYHQKPCALLNVAGYYDRLIEFLDATVERRFLKPVHRSMLLVDERPDALVERMSRYQPPAVVKWIEPNEQ